jgi:hypothetical protein
MGNLRGFIFRLKRAFGPAPLPKLSTLPAWMFCPFVVLYMYAMGSHLGNHQVGSAISTRVVVVPIEALGFRQQIVEASVCVESQGEAGISV